MGKNTFDIGDDFTADFSLHTFDGVLHLTFANTTGSSNEIYYVCYGDFYEENFQSPYGYGPFNIPWQNSLTHVFKVLAGEELTILWRTKMPSASVPPFKTTVYCERNDTTYLTIDF